MQGGFDARYIITRQPAVVQVPCPSSAGGTWTRNLDNCGLPCYKLSQCYAPIPGRPRFQLRGPGGNPNLDKNLDKELGQVLSRVFLLQSHLSKFARGTWTRNLDNCGLPCYKLSQYYPPIPGRPRFRAPRPGGNPNLDKNLDKELGQILSRVFLEPLVQVRLGNLDKELGQLRAAMLQAFSVLRPDSRQAPIPCASPFFFRGRFPNGWILFYLRGSQHSSVQHLTSSCEGFEV